MLSVERLAAWEDPGRVRRPADKARRVQVAHAAGDRRGEHVPSALELDPVRGPVRREHAIGPGVVERAQRRPEVRRARPGRSPAAAAGGRAPSARVRSRSALAPAATRAGPHSPGPHRRPGAVRRSAQAASCSAGPRSASRTARARTGTGSRARSRRAARLAGHAAPREPDDAEDQRRRQPPSDERAVRDPVQRPGHAQAEDLGQRRGRELARAGRRSRCARAAGSVWNEPQLWCRFQTSHGAAPTSAAAIAVGAARSARGRTPYEPGDRRQGDEEDLRRRPQSETADEAEQRPPRARSPAPGVAAQAARRAGSARAPSRRSRTRGSSATRDTRARPRTAPPAMRAAGSPTVRTPDPPDQHGRRRVEGDLHDAHRRDARARHREHRGEHEDLLRPAVRLVPEEDRRVPVQRPLRHQTHIASSESSVPSGDLAIQIRSPIPTRNAAAIATFAHGIASSARGVRVRANR